VFKLSGKIKDSKTYACNCLITSPEQFIVMCHQLFGNGLIVHQLWLAFPKVPKCLIIKLKHSLQLGNPSFLKNFYIFKCWKLVAQIVNDAFTNTQNTTTRNCVMEKCTVHYEVIHDFFYTQCVHGILPTKKTSYTLIMSCIIHV